MRRFFVLLSCVAASCQGEATQTFVHLQADESLVSDAETIHLVIWDDEGLIASDFRFQLGGDRPEATLPATVPVSPRGGDANRTFSLRAALLDASAEEIAVQRAAGGFAEGVAQHITLRFSDECGACDEDERCLDGACVTECAVPSEDMSDEPSPVGECPLLATCRSRRPVSVSLGGTSACAVDESGGLYCWGDGSTGLVGTGDRNPGVRSTPARVVTLETEMVPATANQWTQVSVGEGHASAIHGGSVFSWGNNRNRQIGNGGFESMDPPACTNTCFEGRRAKVNITGRSVQVGGTHTIGITVDDAPYGWGSSAVGQLGFNFADRTNGQPLSIVCRDGDDCSTLSVATACAGTDFSCVIAATGELYCFGSNARSQLGVVQDMPSDMIRRVGDDDDWAQVTCGHEFACGIRGGVLYCWGANDAGQLGVAGDDRAAPERVGSRQDWLHITAGVDHTCGLTTAGELYCWGDNSEGALGTPGPGGADPVRVEGAFSTQSEVALGRMRFDAGRDFTCAVTADDARLLCWGRNDAGQLGRGAIGSVETPGAVCFDR